jgi:thiamine pyrophosphate-dependent acetolactate synthase large subunit-like protein
LPDALFAPFPCRRRSRRAAEQVDKAFAAMAESNVAAILYGAGVFFQVVSEWLVALAARYRIPALYEWLANSLPLAV